jgi:hypothetical protein
VRESDDVSVFLSKVIAVVVVAEISKSVISADASLQPLQLLSIEKQIHHQILSLQLLKVLLLLP